MGSWQKIASYKCVGARGNHYSKFTYTGRTVFIAAIKFVHKVGKIGCHGGAYTNWGCNSINPLNMIVTGMDRALT